MADVLRSCAKTGCRWPAAASLSYRYATRQVWLLDLAPAPDPSLYDLCPHHADHLVVPNGWEAVDDRSVQEVMVEPSADDRAEEAARRRMTAVEPPPRHAVAARRSQERAPQLVGASAGRNRYAALVEQLPKLAAEQAPQEHGDDPAAPRASATGAGAEPAESTAPPASGADAGVEQDAAAAGPPGASDAAARIAAPATEHPAAQPTAPPPGPLADRGRTGPTTGAGRPAPLPARELSPSAADDVTPGVADTPIPETPTADAPLPGQLSIPVDELADDTSGVVLQFDLAGARRRGKGTPG